MPTRSEWLVAKTEAIAERGMVTADHPLAVEAGLEMLRAGGNAVDAAVATAFACGVAEPFFSGVGGIAGLLLRRHDGRAVVVDGASYAAAGARADMFELLEGGTAGMYGWPATRGNAQNVGHRSTGVPGAVACLCLALERYGTLPLERVLAPAIRLAEDGFEIDWYVALAIAAWADRLWMNPEAKRVFFHPDGRPYRPAVGLEPAERFSQPDLARTLRAIADDGPDAFYRGSIARAIAQDSARHGGLITIEELSAYRALEREPVETDYRGYRVLTLPGPTGGLTLIEALNILEGFELGGLDVDSAQALHLLAEASRLAFHDRFAHAADPAFADVPIEVLSSKKHAATRRARIRPDHASALDELPAPRGVPATEHTTHISAVDAARNVVSLTATLGQGFGSGVVPPGTGVVLADVMTWFDPRPGRVNSIAPAKRILWAGSPTILVRDGRSVLAAGAPGGRKLITAVLQTIVNTVDHGMGPQDAVNALRVHAEGPSTLLDSRAPLHVREALAAMGHAIEVKEDTFASSWFGIPNAIAIEADGRLLGGVNRLKLSHAAGI